VAHQSPGKKRRPKGKKPSAPRVDDVEQDAYASNAAPSEAEPKPKPDPAEDDEDDEDEAAASAKADEKVIETARQRFALAQEAEREIRIAAADDRRFRKGDQWPENIRRQREADDRPCLTINKMPQFEQQVTNDQRQNRPAIKVHPVDDKADPETAKVFQGIIKNIEVTSGADTARDTAFENAVRASYGYYRVVTEFESPDSFNQVLRIKRIRDPDTVLLDPNHEEPDGSDAEYGFIYDRMPKDLFCAEFGESKLAKAANWDLEAKMAPDWVEQDTVVVTEYFYKDYVTKELVLLSDGQVMEKSESEEYIASTAAQEVDVDGVTVGDSVPTVQVVKERTARVPTVRWCKMNALEILDRTDWLGQWIPILPVYGAELVVDGKLVRESLIRHAKDPARMYNFWKSAETEAITLAPRAPFVVAEGQVEGFEADWDTANRRNHAYLVAKAYDDQGRPLPPPQRQVFEPAINAITQASMLAADEVKQTIGIYDSSLGARSNETSGKAILARNNQAQTSNFHFNDNLNRTIRHEGRILVDLIPKVYDTAQIARIIGEDGEHKRVLINKEFKDESGKIVKHDLSVGKYDVTIDTGPTYATRRQEASQFMQEMVRAYPQTMQVAGDLVVKNMDVPGAADLAERFKKTLAPGLIDDPKNKQIPPQVQAQMAQMSQMLAQLQKDRADLLTEREQKLVEIESRERIEFAKIKSTEAIELAKLDAKDALALLGHQISQIEGRLSLLNYEQPIDGGQGAPGAAPQVPPMPADGAPGADVGAPGEDPTGGESPGPIQETPEES
jgi:hypothetical protein